MSSRATVPAPASGRPFENLMTGMLLATGFIVDVDVVWTVAGEGDVAQFDIVASAPTGSRLHRVIVECKGGDKWGYRDAFQLLGEVHTIGESQGLLFGAQRRSLERGSRTAAAIDRLFVEHGVHVLGVPIDDRVPEEPVIDLRTVTTELYTRGLVPLPDANAEIDVIEVCTRGVARLRGAMDRVVAALSHPLSPLNPPAATLMNVVREWAIISRDAVERLAAVRSALVPSIGSQQGWDWEAKVAHPHFGRDVAIVETYAGAHEIAALADAIRQGWTIPPRSNVSRELRQRLSTLDLHAAAHAAYVLALVPPSSGLASEARAAHGQTIASLTTADRLRRRCREPRAKKPARAKRRRRH